MNDGDLRDEIVRLEAKIDELAARIESCRKFILAGRIAVAGAGVVLIAMLVGAIPFGPSVIAATVAAGVGRYDPCGSEPRPRREARRKLSGAWDKADSGA